ncbi:inositol monophosphatase family protein [Halostella litorea]|uniref:inositol monophosphatase family protein n=1 Tax=Halostella litorea TaxID=2528831 RepID=UPI001091DC8C|nr:inositol monophosphatase [Halostella litorea]
MDVRDTAVEACRAGGEYLRERFAAGTTDAEFDEHDVKAVADRESEKRMLSVIRDAHPDHHVYAEESGDHEGDGECSWIVDPLDGTNNFTAGLPTFATAAAVRRDGSPAAAAVYLPVLDDLYVAAAGDGVRFNGATVTATGRDEPVAHATVAFVIGHRVKREAAWMETATGIDAALTDRCKRRIETWSPTVHWGLLARGRIDGFVCYRPDREEQVAGELLAREAGCVARADGPLSVFATDGATADALWDTVAPERP